MNDTNNNSILTTPTPVVVPVRESDSNAAVRLSWFELQQEIPVLRWIEQDIEATNVPDKMPGYYLTWRQFERRIIEAIRRSTITDKRFHFTLAHREMRYMYWQRAVKSSHIKSKESFS